MMKILLITLPAVVLILSGCATPETIVKTVEVPVTVIVPANAEAPATCPECPVCPTAGPTSAPVPTGAPPPAEVPAPTEGPVDALKAPKGVGSYLVGVDIAPGIWRSSGPLPSGMSGCMLEVSTLAGDTEEFSYKPPGATVEIPAGEWQVTINGCVWTFYK